MMQSNEGMVHFLTSSRIIGRRIADCMLRFPRSDFLPPSLKPHAYEDIPLPISNMQTTSAPSMIGIMLREAELDEGMNVLEVGTGSGWQTALLSCLVGKRGKVHSVEIFKEIHSSAKELLGELPNVHLHLEDGIDGHPSGGPYDRIIASAAANEVYPGLLSQLGEGGILIIPLKVPGEYAQQLYKITKLKKGLKEEKICPVLFVSMYEGRDGKPR